jgi:hypothetical protein
MFADTQFHSDIRGNCRLRAGNALALIKPKEGAK